MEKKIIPLSLNRDLPDSRLETEICQTVAWRGSLYSSLQNRRRTAFAESTKTRDLRIALVTSDHHASFDNIVTPLQKMGALGAIAGAEKAVARC